MVDVEYVYAGPPSSFVYRQPRWFHQVTLAKLREITCKILKKTYDAGSDDLCRVETFPRIEPPREKGGEPVVVMERVSLPTAAGWALKTAKEYDCEWARDIPLPDCLFFWP